MPAPPTSGSAHAALESDRALISRVVANDDRQAFQILVERHQGAVRSILRRLSRGDRALADDLAQITMLRAYMTLDTFQGKAELRTWLYRIACNEFFQYRRGRSHNPGILVEQHDVDHKEIASQDISTQTAMSIDLERAMLTLSEAERDAIVLAYFAEMSHQEAATALGCPLGTVKSNIARGKVKLYQALLAWAPKRSEVIR